MAEFDELLSEEIARLTQQAGNSAVGTSIAQ